MNERSRTPLSKPMELVEKIAFEVVQPLLIERAVLEEGDGLDISIESMPGNDGMALNAVLDQRHAVFGSISPVDESLARLRLGFVAGCSLLVEYPFVIQLAYFLNDSGFHVRFDTDLSRGVIAVEGEIFVREEDLALVDRQLSDLLSIADKVEWFVAMMHPQLLPPGEQHDGENGEIGDRLSEMFALPVPERDAEWMFSVARGLGRWQDMLKILRQHPDLLAAEDKERYRMLAFRMLGRWEDARKAAENGGIDEGRFADARWISPSYLEILLHLDDGIEILRLLRTKVGDEPGFYDCYRARAYLSLDMVEEADAAFTSYMVENGGDVASLMRYSELRGEMRG